MFSSIFRFIKYVRSFFINFGNHLYSEKSEIKTNIISNRIFSFSMGQLVVIIGVMSYIFFAEKGAITQKQYLLNVIPAVSTLLILAVCYLLKNLLPWAIFQYFAYLAGIAYVSGMSMMHGKDAGIQFYLFALVPMPFFGLAAHRKLSIYLGAIFCVFTVGVVLYAQNQYPPFSPLKREYQFYIYLAAIVNALLTLYFSSFYLFSQTNITEKELVQERNKSESLLKSILPEKIIHQIREKGRADPVHFKSATVLFTDFVGFTRISEELSAQKLVEELHVSFSYFDTVMRRYSLEKLKTIGDAYMAVGGLPEKNKTHAIDAVLAALEILTIMKEVRKTKQAKNEKAWQIRIGIHTGPLVAGVIGEEKFSYDVWGETVSIADFLQLNAVPGTILVTQEVYERLEGLYNFDPGPDIELPEINQTLATWLLTNPTSSLFDSYSRDHEASIPQDTANNGEVTAEVTTS